MRYVRAAALIAFSTGLCSTVFGQIDNTLSITNYQFLSEQRVSQTQSSVTYRADLVNLRGSLGSVTATLTSLDPFSVRPVPGQDKLNFAPVPANSQVTSINTFTILVDRTVQFSWNKVIWVFTATAQGPVANAGPNQTASPGSTVVLNGSGSTDPSGMGSLTYSWTFVSRPPGSSTVLMNPTTVSPSFVVSSAGTYIVRLTVSNGVASSSADVTISTSNSAPVANAGPSQSVSVGNVVTLNGGASSDVDGDSLTYSWKMLTLPTGSAAALSNPASVGPSFIVDKPGTYTVQLVVNDGRLDSAPASVTITTNNALPVANAGPNQNVKVGDLVQLDGSKSTDVDGDALTYHWTMLSTPSGSAAVLSSLTAVNPTFTADKPGTYSVQLIVNDGKANSSAITVSIATAVVQAPTANAGPDQTIAHGSTVTLSGGGTDPQGLSLTLTWALTSKPTGSNATLSSLAIPNPTFVADLPGKYVAQLIVNNGVLNSPPATVQITTTNTVPVANPGSNQTVAVGATASLDGTTSSDADHDPLTYSWSFISRPANSSAVLTGAKSATPSFLVDAAGPYVIQLIVNDGYSNSSPVTVTITGDAMSVTLSPDPLNLYLEPGTLTVSLVAPAPAGGQVVALASLDPNVASVPLNATVPQNATGVNVTVTPHAIGSTIVSATVPGFRPGIATVIVAVPTISVTLASGTLGLGRTMNGTISLSAPAPSTGTVVQLSANKSGLVDLQPASLTIPAGSTSGMFTVKGLALGSLTITGSSAGYTSGSANVNVTLLGLIIVESNLSVGLGQSTALQVSLNMPAPVGGVTIALSSSDTSKLTVTPSVTIPELATTPVTPPMVTGVALGSAVVSASALGFTGDSQSVKVVGTLSFTPNPLTLNVGDTQNLTLKFSNLAPVGGLLVSLSSSNSLAASVPATVTIAQNTDTITVPVTALAAGLTVIHANAANVNEGTASVTVQSQGSIGLPSNVTLAPGQSAAFPITLAAPAPSNVTVTLVSSDTGKVTLSASTFTIAAGQKQPSSQPQVTGANFGSATITASAAGYTGSSQAVQVAGSLSFSPWTVAVAGAITQNVQLSLSAPAPAGGLSIALTSNAPSIASVPQSTTIAQNATSVTVPITTSSAGQATITASANAPNVTNATIAVTVTGLGTIGLPTGVSVALGQSVPFPITLPVAAPADVTVTLTSSDLSKVSPSVASVVIPAGQKQPNQQPTVTGNDVGSAYVTASAPGFGPATEQVQVTATIAFTPASLTINGFKKQNLTLTLSAPAPTGGLTINCSSSNTNVATVPQTIAFAANATTVALPVTSLAVGAAVIHASGTNIPDTTANVTVDAAPDIDLPVDIYVAPGEVVAFPVSLSNPSPSGTFVQLVSSDESKLTVQQFILINAGQTKPAADPKITGVSPGTVTITATAPGLATATTTVDVGYTLHFSPQNEQISGTATKNIALVLSSAAPQNGLTITLSSSDPAVATVPSSVTFTGNATTVNVPVKGVAPGKTVIHASAIDIPDTTANVTVSAPGTIGLPAGMTVALGQAVAFPVTLSSPAPAGGVTVTLSSSDSAKVSLSTNSVTIAQGATTPTTQPQVTGVNVGPADITATASGYTSATQTVQVNATVSFAENSISILQNSTGSLHLVLSASAPLAGLTVNLSSSNSAVATIPPSVGFYPDGSAFTTVNILVTGLAPGTAVIHASGTNIPDVTTTVTVIGPLQITTSSLPAGAVNTAYSQTLHAAGGTSPYGWVLTAGTLPAGLSLNPSSGLISGTPTVAVSGTPLTFKVTDSGSPAISATVNLTLTITPTTLAITTASLPDGKVGVAYSQTLSASGGTPGFTWAVTGGALPAGLTLNPTSGVISGTPTAAVANLALTFKLTDAGSPAQTATANLTMTILPPNLAITTTSLPDGKVGVAYSQLLAASGGTPTLNWTLTAGQLPAGLTLNAMSGLISGTPTAPAANTALTFKVTDSGSPVQTATVNLTLTIAPASLTITTSSLPDGKVGAAYSQTLSATGGTPGFSWTQTSGTLPAGLALNASGLISGTPTAAATNVALTFKVTDSGSPAQTASVNLTLTIAPPTLTITTTSLADGKAGVPYSQTLTATGGTAGITWTQTAGTLPAGLTLSASGVIAGTPTAVTASTPLTFQAKDSGTPAQIATVNLTLTIAPPALSVTTTTLPDGTVNSAYSQTLAATGGTPGLTWTKTAGTLPAGLTLFASGLISGTPTAVVTNTPLTFQVKDSGTPAQTATVNLTLTIAPATLTITTSSLAAGKVGVAYSQTLAATGGTPAFTWTKTAGSLPAGLTLNAATGEISGTPTAQVSNSALTFKVTDSGTPAQTASVNVSLTVAPATLAISTSSLADGQVGVPYSQTLTATGGTPAFTWVLVSGTLPAGLSLNAATGQISGTPTAISPTAALLFRVTDSGSPGQSAVVNLSMAVKPATLAITTVSLNSGQVGTPYSQTLAATGGTPGYTWTIASGSLPAGLALNASTGEVSGTPTAAVSGVALTFKVTDSGSPAQTATLPVSLTIAPPGLAILTSALANGQVGVPYSQTLSVAGGTPAYTWTLTSGTLPGGLSLGASTGQITGTPTAAVSKAALTFKVTDSGSPVQTATVNLTLAIAPPTLAITTSSLPDGKVGVAYSQNLAASGGTPALSWTLTSGSLPSGLALDGATGKISGTPTASVTNAALTFKVTDSGSPAQSATVNLSLTVTPPTLLITTSSLPNGTAGVAYSQTLVATGGTPSLTWTQTAGTLPSGLSLSASGLISGTTSVLVTNIPLTFKVTDSGSPAQSATVNLTLTIVAPSLTITTTSLLDGKVGVAYSQSLASTGGTPALTWTQTSGTLPAGLSLSAAGLISGTPTAAVVNTPLTFKVTDSGSPAQTATVNLTLTIAPATLTVTTTTLPNGKVGVAYSQQLAATGGTPSFTWTQTSGTLPAGLSLSAAGLISGTPTAAVSNSALIFKVTDSGSPAQIATVNLTLTIAPPSLTVTTTTLPDGRVGVAYSQTLAATGGTGGLTWTQTAGTLPAGLSLSAAGLISGTPSAVVTNTPLTFRVTDSGSPTQSDIVNLTLTIAPPILTITTTTLPDGRVGVAYSQALAATGGTPGLTWMQTAGTLPAGLTLSAAGLISGTPTAFVSNTPLTFKVTDSGSPAQSATVNLTLTIAPPVLTITTTTLPNGKVGVAYSQTLAATGGAPSLTWTQTAGTLPAGLTLNASGLISGTPTAIVSNTPLTFKVTDSGSPAQTATVNLTLTIAPATLTITTTSLPDGQVGAAYSQQLAATGGTPSITWTLTSGTLPAGLSLSASGAISGTPTASVSNRALSFLATDSGSPAQTATVNLTLTIAPGTLAITTSSLPDAQVGVAYSQTLTATGGTTPLTWSLTSGTLPAGLTLNATTGLISGTPTATSANASRTFSVTDSGTPPQTATVNITMAVKPATLAITTSALPNGQVGVAYSQTIAITGGTPGFTWSIIAGSLPNGLSLTPSTGSISGTPTAAVSALAVTLKVVDSGSPAQNATVNLTLTIAPAGLAINTASLAVAMTGIAYSQTLVASGGTPSYSWTLIAGTLPLGLSLDGPTGTISGIPQVTVLATPLTFRVRDSGSPAQVAQVDLTLTVTDPVYPLSVSSVSIGANLQALITVSIPQPAPAGGVNVTLTSSDATKLLLGQPAASGFCGTGCASMVINIGAGQTTVSTYAKAKAGTGTAQITATAPGFTTGSGTITLTPSGFALIGPNGIGVSSFSISKGVTTPLTVAAYRLDPATQALVEAQIVAADVTVPVNSSSTLVGTVSPISVSLSTGDSSAQVVFSALAQGATTVSAVVPTIPTGFSTPTGGAANLLANVTPPGMSAANVTVGKDLATTANVTLAGAAPAGGLLVTISSSNASKVLLSTTPTGAGLATITINITAGHSATPDFYVYGLDSTGSVSYSASAPGFGSATGSVTLMPSGFVIYGPNGLGVDFSTTTGAANQNLTIYSAQLDAGLNYVGAQTVRGGLQIQVAVNSSLPSVGTITSSPVTITGGSASAITQFDPAGAGTTTLSASSAGYSVPVSYGSLSATVGAPKIQVTDGVAVGQGLQITGMVLLGQAAPAGGLTLTLTDNSGQLRFSSSPTTAGLSLFTLTVPAGHASATYYIQGVGSSGSATYTATASGYTSDTGTITLNPAGVIIKGPFGYGYPLWAYLATGAQPVTVSMAMLDSGGTPLEVQQLAGGSQLSITLTVDDSNIGTIQTPVSITGGADSVNAALTPKAVGSTMVRVTKPGGLALPNAYTALSVQVM